MRFVRRLQNEIRTNLEPLKIDDAERYLGEALGFASFVGKRASECSHILEAVRQREAIFAAGLGAVAAGGSERHECKNEHGLEPTGGLLENSG